MADDTPYVRRDPGALIRSGDWNEIQIRTRKEIHEHDHTGEDNGVRITGEAIDPTSDVTVHDLSVTGHLNIRDPIKGAARDVLKAIDELEDALPGKLSLAGGAITGSLTVQQTMSVDIDVKVGGALAIGTGAAITRFSTDTSLREDSDAVVPTERAVRAYVRAQVPRGIIVMWFGASEAVPEGWTICNGSNGTPDLRDRFVVAAGRAYSVGNTGGEAMHRLSLGEMPVHAHEALAGGRDDYNFTGGNSSGGERIPFTRSDADHCNVETTRSAGGGQPHENRPPYHALLFIMKL